MTENRFSKFKEAAPAQNRFSQFAGPTRENAAAAGLPEQLPKERSITDRIADFTRTLSEGLSLGFGDEGAALIKAVAGDPETQTFFDYSKPFGERYNAGLESEKEQREGFAERNPVLAPLTELGGALATTAILGRGGLTLAGRAATTRGVMAAGATEGAVYGSVYGAGKAEPGERLTGAAYGAGTGAAIGGAVSGALKKGADVLMRGKAARATPTVDQLEDAASALYRRAADQDVIYAPQAWQGFVANLKQELADEAFDKGLHPGVGRVLERLDDVSTNTGVSLKGAEVYRKLIQAAYDPTKRDNNRLLAMVRERLDDFMTDPANVAAVKGDARVAMGALTQARQTWALAQRGRAIDDAIKAAELRAGSTYSGGNIENALRQEFKKILTSKRKARGFSADELAEIEAFVTGGSKALRTLAKLSPVGSGLMASLGLGATVANPLMAAAPAAGMMAKALGDRGAMAGAQNLGTMARAGGQVLTQPPPGLSEMQRAALARALAGYGGGATGGALTGKGR